MSIPTKRELDIAIAEAIRMKESGEDPLFLAKSLLNLHYRVHYLEKVFHTAEHYLYFGQEEIEHSHLVKAIEAARREERHIRKIDSPPTFGL